MVRKKNTRTPRDDNKNGGRGNYQLARIQNKDFICSHNQMNQSHYLKRFEEITKQMLEITKAKNNDYSGKDNINPFKNFEAVETFGIKTEDGFITRMTDKLMRISNLTIQEASVSDEKITDTLIDLANYCLLFKIRLEGKDTN